MDREGIIRMAIEAGGVFIDPPCGDCYTFDIDNGELERFAALVAAAARAEENEACAKVAEEPYEFTSEESHRIASAIRARRNT